VTSSDAGPVAELPAAVTVLPRSVPSISCDRRDVTPNGVAYRRSGREKPIPQPKKETKWEKFAREKGIKKKKKDRMIWDEPEQEWRPRWGFKRANAGVEELPIVEVKPVSQPPVSSSILVEALGLEASPDQSDLNAAFRAFRGRQGQDPFADPWSEARKEKKGRVAKNLEQQAKNKASGTYPQSMRDMARV
jgi:hypothetical protein